MHNKLRFFTKALKFEREFIWPLVGPVTMQQVMISALVLVISTLSFLIIFPAKLAPACGFICAATIWFLYGAIKPDGKRIHRFCIDVVKYIFRHKKKNMGDNVYSVTRRVHRWTRIQE